MKKYFIIILLSIISLCGYGQQSQDMNEDNVYITMTLNSVIEYIPQGNFYIKISNTENILVNFCEKVIKVQPGIHRIYLEVDDTCTLMVLESYHMDLERVSSSYRIIKNGMENYNPGTGVYITTDYIEYTVCDFIMYNR
jgi:hypothetical protein